MQKWLLVVFVWHLFLLLGQQEYALTVFYPREEMVHQGHTTVGYLRMQMVVAHGGRCAERILFGDNVSDGGQDDLQKISGVCILFIYVSDLFLAIST